MKEKAEIRGTIHGPPRELIECGLARVIKYRDLPKGSWQRDEVDAGRRTFTEMIPEDESQSRAQTVPEIAETATAQAIEVEGEMPEVSQAAA